MSNNNVAIPTNTSISMDVDFGASKNHISNGKLIVNDNVNNYNETFQFDGNIVDTKSNF
ncbi:MAG: hypothetical protein U5K55_15640 [Aliarcobacter sp.]|nr:hypothetical protein [Aliarcobacter sp.]